MGMNNAMPRSREDINLSLRTAHAAMIFGTAKRCDGRYGFARQLVSQPVQLTAKLSRCWADGVRTADVAAIARANFLGQLG